MSRLRLLDNRKPTWRRPDDEVVEDVIVPALQAADQFDCMVGYFGGAALRELSHGLAAYILRGDQPFRLLVSPVISDSDQEGIRLGAKKPEDILAHGIQAAFNDEIALASALAQHTKQCFAYLLAKGRLQMKVVLVRGATFHLKEWIFKAGSDVAVLSGSANFTGQALLGNVERLNLHRNWRGGDSEIACQDAIDEFEAYWTNSKDHAVAVDIPVALQEGLVQSYDTRQPPTETDYRKAIEIEGRLHRSDSPGAVEASPHGKHFAPPSHLIWETGPYSHQGTAVLKWEGAERRGILAMATGSGKTVTALLCAWRLWREVKDLVVIITAPTLPLIAQWEEECKNFGLDPYIAGNHPRAKRLRNIEQMLQGIEYTQEGLVVLVITNDFLNDGEFKGLLNEYSCPIMLVSDEVHNLGGTSFFNSPPDQIIYRLGLSATPVRQYDEEGTEKLFHYFGDTVYEFTLGQAIGVCLVSYNYQLHAINLDTQELEEYRYWSDEIRKLRRIVGDGPSGEERDRLQRLYNKRRLVLETAEGKLAKLKELLIECKGFGTKHLLIYATDKDPDQLNQVNELVRDVGMRFHQITANETRNAKLVESVLSSYRSGALEVLTAKRVLDEGLDVPEISTAIILASTTVERQWVQRRGRVLRMCPAIGKETSTIHDFIVLPPAGESRDDEVEQLIKSEVKRCDEFTRLASNAAAPGGPRDLLQDVRLDYIV